MSLEIQLKKLTKEKLVAECISYINENDKYKIFNHLLSEKNERYKYTLLRMMAFFRSFHPNQAIKREMKKITINEQNMELWIDSFIKNMKI